MTARKDAFSPQRHATRAPMEKRARLVFEKSQTVLEGDCRNISIGGMFVCVQPVEQAVGSTVRFELILDGETAIRGLADVMWQRQETTGPDQEAGFGLKFKFLEQRDRQLIFKLVSRHIKDRLASRYPPPVEPPPVQDLVVPAVVAPRLLDDPPVETQSSEAAVPGTAIPEVPELPVPELPVREIPEIQVSEAEIPAFIPASQSAPLISSSAAADSAEPPGVSDRGSIFASPEGIATPASSADRPSSLSDMFIASEGELDLPLVPASETEADLPLTSEGRNDSDDETDPYLRHLGEDHFEHRPAPKRDFPVLPMVAVVAVLAAAMGYLFSDQLFDWVQPGVSANGPPLVVGSNDSAPANPLIAESEPGEASSPESAEVLAPPRGQEDQLSPSAEDAGGQDAADDPEPEVPVAPPARPAEPPTSTSTAEAAEQKPFKRLLDLSWRARGTRLVLTLKTDGEVERSRVDHFRLPGDAPREVIRLLGMSKQFERQAIVVGTAGVRQIRFGWHRKRRGNEVHLVLDIDNPASEVRSVATDGANVIIEIGY